MRIRGDLYRPPSSSAVNAIITQTVILKAMEGVGGHAPSSHITWILRTICHSRSLPGLLQAGGLLQLPFPFVLSGRFQARPDSRVLVTFLLVSLAQGRVCCPFQHLSSRCGQSFPPFASCRSSLWIWQAA